MNWIKILGLPELASEHGKALDELTGYVHLLMLILFIGWVGYFIMVLLKFNRKSNPKADYVGVKSHLNTYLEVGVAVVEGVLLIGFAIPLWAKAVDYFPTAADNPIEVHIMAQQFAWNAHFAGPDGKWGKQDIQFAAATNPFGLDPNDADAKDDVVCLKEEFLVPVNRHVICKIGSMDVIHCFKLPAMRVTQDAVPGLSIPVHFKPTITNTYEIYCAQLCGNLHSGMKGSFKVVSQSEYDTWYAAKSKAGGGAGFE